VLKKTSYETQIELVLLSILYSELVYEPKMKLSEKFRILSVCKEKLSDLYRSFDILGVLSFRKLQGMWLVSGRQGMYTKFCCRNLLENLKEVWKITLI
jgi:hypothetical protein